MQIDLEKSFPSLSMLIRRRRKVVVATLIAAAALALISIMSPSKPPKDQPLPVTSGYLAVPVSITDENVLSIVEVGDRVDIMAARTDDNDSFLARRIAHDVRVLAIMKDQEIRANPRAAAGSILIEATPQTALALAGITTSHVSVGILPK